MYEKQGYKEDMKHRVANMLKKRKSGGSKEGSKGHY